MGFQKSRMSQSLSSRNSPKASQSPGFSPQDLKPKHSKHDKIIPVHKLRGVEIDQCEPLMASGRQNNQLIRSSDYSAFMSNDESIKVANSGVLGLWLQQSHGPSDNIAQKSIKLIDEQ